VERCYLVSKSGAVSPLEPGPDGAATVVPTFTPAQFERTLNTRAATSSVERRQRTMNVRRRRCNDAGTAALPAAGWWRRPWRRVR
jgi:hypothetical protein